MAASSRGIVCCVWVSMQKMEYATGGNIVMKKQE